MYRVKLTKIWVRALICMTLVTATRIAMTIPRAKEIRVRGMV